MKIGVDASKLLESQALGVERATRFLLTQLFELDRSNEYRLFAPAALPPSWRRSNVTPVLVPTGPFWTALRLSEALVSEELDIFYQPGNILPLRLPKNTKAVVTIHDLAAVAQPLLYPPKESLLSYLTVLQAARRAKRIIAVSQATAGDLSRFFALSSKRIEVIHHGPPRGILKRTGKLPPEVKGEFFLVVGRVELRKNPLRILEAFASYQRRGGTLKLVLAGPAGFGYVRIKEKVKQLGAKNVIFLGFVEEEALNALYAKAKALIFPSLYEGFGLPILEAFSYGLPVLTSNFGATKEVGGEAALLLDPLNVAELSKALDRIVDDTQLRGWLIERGKKRLKEFSWVKAAQKLKEIFESL